MGFSKWMLTHGPGSPGSIAKRITMNYMDFKNMYPSFSNDQLLFIVAKERIENEKTLGVFNPFSPEEMLEQTNGDLKGLIYFFVMIENQDRNGFPTEAPLNTQFLIHDVINEIVDKYKR